MLVTPEALLSSFGPFGRSKLIKKELSGEILISRDGQQILEYCTHTSSSSSSAFLSVMRAACIDFGNRHGDGSSSAILLLEFLLNHIICRYPNLMRVSSSSQYSSSKYSIGSSNSFGSYGKDYQKRIQFLQSFNVVKKILQSNAQLIKTEFINCKVFQEISDHKLFARGIWTNLLVPATNPTTATRIISLLLKWFDIEGSLHLGGSDITSICQFQHICKFLLDRIDVYIVSTSIGSFHDSYILGNCEFMLEGRLLEYASLLPSVSLETIHASEEDTDSFHFVCVKNINCKLDMSVGVEVSDSHDLRNLFKIGNSYLRHSFYNLRKNSRVHVIFTSDSVDGDVLSLLKSFHLQVIDRVPSNYLIGLATFAHVQIIDSCDSFIHDKDTALDLIFKKSIGSFQYAEKIVFSPHETFVLIHGVDRKKNYPSILHERNTNSTVSVSQMILHGNGSESIANVYKRLIKRCLQLAVAAKVNTRDVVGNAGGSTGLEYVCVAAGLGTVEIAWCKLLRKLSSVVSLDECNNSQFENGDIRTKKVSIEQKLAYQLKKCYPRSKHTVWMTNVSFILEAISSAHENILKLMLANAFSGKSCRSRNRKVEDMLRKVLEPKKGDCNYKYQREEEIDYCIDDRKIDIESILGKIDIFESPSENTLPFEGLMSTSYTLENLSTLRLDVVLELVQLFLRVDHHHVISYEV